MNEQNNVKETQLKGSLVFVGENLEVGDAFVDDLFVLRSSKSTQI